MIALLLHHLMMTCNRLLTWLATQSPPRLILLAQAALLVAYLLLTVVARFYLSSAYGYTISIRVQASPSKVWDHIQDVRKNPISAKQCVATTVMSDREWTETIGSDEVIVCRVKEAKEPTRLERDCTAPAVSCKGQVVYLLSSTTSTNQDDNNNSSQDDMESTTTLLRIFVTIESEWGSFYAPFVRLVLTFRPKLLETATQDYLKALCRDMGLKKYKIAEAWE